MSDADPDGPFLTNREILDHALNVTIERVGQTLFTAIVVEFENGHVFHDMVQSETRFYHAHHEAGRAAEAVIPKLWVMGAIVLKNTINPPKACLECGYKHGHGHKEGCSNANTPADGRETHEVQGGPDEDA